jgi:hypothetical protein
MGQSKPRSIGGFEVPPTPPRLHLNKIFRLQVRGLHIAKGITSGKDWPRRISVFDKDVRDPMLER